MDSKESAFWPRCAFICFSDSLPSSCCLGERRGILLKLDFLLLEKWFRTLSAYQRIRTRCVRQTSHRTGPFITGHTGWYGVWQHRSSLAAFPAEEPCARQFSADTVLVWVPRLSALLFLEIIRWESRFQVQLISFRSIMKMGIYIIWLCRWSKPCRVHRWLWLLY